MTLLYKCSEGVGRMTFDFPAKKNALDQAARKEMERIVTEVRTPNQHAQQLVGRPNRLFWVPHLKIIFKKFT